MLDRVDGGSNTREVPRPASRGTGELAKPPEPEAPKPKGTGDLQATSGESRLHAYAPDDAPADRSLISRVEGTAFGLWGRIRHIFASDDPKPAAVQPGTSDTSTPAVSPEPAKADEKPAASAANDDATVSTQAAPSALEQRIEKAKAMAPAEAAEHKARRDPIGDAERAANAERPVEDAQQGMYSNLSEPEQTAFRELSPDARNAFFKVFNRIGGNWAVPTENSKIASEGLKKLLVEHKLESRDFRGHSMLYELSRRVNDKVDPRLQPADGIGVLQSVIRQVAYPDHVYQGENTNTCAAAALQTIVANEEPAEYVRLAAGISFDGKVQLQNGERMDLDTRELSNNDDGGRSFVSKALQGSFKAYAERYPAEDADDFGGGRLGGGGHYGGGRLGGGGHFGDGTLGEEVKLGGKNGGQVGGGGLTESQIGHLYEDVVGRMAVELNVNKQNVDAAFEGIHRTLASGMQVPVGVQGHDAEGHATNHVVTIVGMEHGEDGQRRVRFTDSSSGKEYTMDGARFADALKVVILPAEHADHRAWNISPGEEPKGDGSDFGGGRLGGGGRGG